MQLCLTPFTQYKVKGHLVQICKKSNKVIEIMTRKSDKNQLEPGKGIGLSPKIYQFDIHFIFWSYYLICIFMNINDNLKLRTKPLDKLVPQGVIRPTLNAKEHFLLMSNG